MASESSYCITELPPEERPQTDTTHNPTATPTADGTADQTATPTADTRGTPIGIPKRFECPAVWLERPENMWSPPDHPRLVWCLLCRVKLTNVAMLSQHLASDEHWSKRQFAPPKWERIWRGRSYKPYFVHWGTLTSSWDCHDAYSEIF